MLWIVAGIICAAVACVFMMRWLPFGSYRGDLSHGWEWNQAGSAGDAACGIQPGQWQPSFGDQAYREFVHSLLNKCGVLKDYPSKLFAPYTIENTAAFREFEIVKYSEVVRFRYLGPDDSGSSGRLVQKDIVGDRLIEANREN